MTKLERLKKELSKCASEIKRIKEKESQLQNKIEIEEQKEIRQMMKEHHLSVEDLEKILKNKT